MAPAVVERAERRAAARRPGAGPCGGGGVDERQLLRRRAPRGELEREPGQVDLGDLGRPVGRPGAVLHPAPQPVGHAGLGAPGPPGPLVGRVAADRHRRQPGHPGARIEARRAGQAAVDDDAHAVHRQRRLGDVGGQHDAPPTRRRRGQRPVLLLERQRAGQRGGRRRRGRGAVELLGEPGDLADAGQEHEDVAVLVAQRPTDARRPTAASRRSSRRPRQPADVDRVRPPALSTTGRGPPAVGQQAGEQRGVGRRRHRQDAQVGAQRRRRVERERQAEVGRQVALVDLVEDHQRRRRAAPGPAAGGGSARPR